MNTRTKNARLNLRDTKTGLELPVMHLQDADLVLARMFAPGAVHLVLETTLLTRVTVHLDAVQLLHTEELLAPGRHVLRPAGLVLRPGEAQLDKPPHVLPSDDDVFLASLGIEPAPYIDTARDLPYIGAAGGVLTVRLGYWVEDTGRVKEIETASDELVIKLNAGQDFDRAIASNAHRLTFSDDADAVAQPTLCGTCSLVDGHHHH